jgi:hypothetical protein
VRSRRRKAVGGSCKKFGEVNRSAESTKTRERRLGGVASTIGSSVNYLRRQKFTESGTQPRRRSCPFSATAAARLGLGSGPKLGLGSSARPWLLFKRPQPCASSQARGVRGGFARAESGFPWLEVGDAADQRVPPGGDLRSRARSSVEERRGER